MATKVNVEEKWHQDEAGQVFVCRKIGPRAWSEWELTAYTVIPFVEYSWDHPDAVPEDPYGDEE